jgi:AcrR family transcriptional regulator
MPDNQPGLRQRKKERTRQAITDAAMAMFLEHGFENVSIIKIAAAAEVSVQTVYNYFPAKADLVFDEADQIASDLQRAVRHRPPGQSALSALRGYFASLPARVGDRRPPEPTPRFRRLVRDSPALRAYQREIFARFEHALAAALADETGASPDAVEPFIAAAGLVAVFRVNLEGRDSDAEPPGQRAGRALDLLEHGLGDYAVSPAPPHAPHRTNAASARLTAAP